MGFSEGELAGTILRTIGELRAVVEHYATAQRDALLSTLHAKRLAADYDEYELVARQEAIEAGILSGGNAETRKFALEGYLGNQPHLTRRRAELRVAEAERDEREATLRMADVRQKCLRQELAALTALAGTRN